MLAKELIESFVKEEKRDLVSIIAISQSKPVYWYHVHSEEGVPDCDYEVAVHIRYQDRRKKK